MATAQSVTSAATHPVRQTSVPHAATCPSMAVLAPFAHTATSGPECPKIVPEFAYDDARIGHGALAESGKLLLVHYIGYNTDGTKFDSSIDRNEPFSFTLGAGQVIKGWELGLRGMRVGGRRRIYIPAEFAYGHNAVGAIHPDAMLTFDVDLLAVMDPGLPHDPNAVAKTYADIAEEDGRPFEPLNLPGPPVEHRASCAWQLPDQALPALRGLSGCGKLVMPMIYEDVRLGSGATADRNRFAQFRIISKSATGEIAAGTNARLVVKDPESPLDVCSRLYFCGLDGMREGGKRRIFLLPRPTDQASPTDTKLYPATPTIVEVELLATSATNSFLPPGFKPSRPLIPGSQKYENFPEMDIAEIKQRADHGDIRAQVELADRYLNGRRGIAKDLTLGIAILTRGAGVPEIDTELAFCFRWGVGVDKDVERANALEHQAFETYSKRANQGDVEAIFQTAEMYDWGRGVDKDKGEAFARYKAASDAGYLPAKASLGRAYFYGSGVPADIDRGLALVQESYEEGVKRSAFTLGQLYQFGQTGNEANAINLEKAYFWYSQADAMGDGCASKFLGDFNAAGKGRPKDMSQAAAWWIKASALNCFGANNALGTMYYLGDGVPQDFSLAKIYFEKAIAGGYVDPGTLKIYQQNLANAEAAIQQQSAAQQVVQQGAAEEQASAIEASQEHRAWQRRVDQLTRDVESAEQNAVDAEALADKYANDSSTAASSGDLGGAILGALNVGVAAKYKNDALKARNKADSMRAELERLGADEPAAPTEASSAIQSIVSTPTAAPNNAIADELKRQQANIAAAQARAQQAQAAASTAQQGSNTNGTTPPAVDHGCLGGEKNYQPGKGCLLRAQ